MLTHLGIRSTPRVSAVARERSRPFCQKWRWQLQLNTVYSLHMWLCMKWHGAWLHGVHGMRWDGSRFMWHQPCQCCKYTTSVNMQKCTIKKEAVHSYRLASKCNESAWEWRIVLYRSNQQQGCTVAAERKPPFPENPELPEIIFFVCSSFVLIAEYIHVLPKISL